MIVELGQIETNLSRYLEEVARGETILVTRNHQPIAEIRPVPLPSNEPRPLGLGQGLGTIHADCFEPLPPDSLAGFTKENE